MLIWRINANTLAIIFSKSIGIQDAVCVKRLVKVFYPPGISPRQHEAAQDMGG